MDEFKALLDKAIAECFHEIKLREAGVPGEASLPQLNEVILPELLSLQKMQRMELLKGKGRWLTSYGGAFFDWGWDMQNPTKLFLMLRDLNSLHRKL